MTVSRFQDQKKKKKLKRVFNKSRHFQRHAETLSQVQFLKQWMNIDHFNTHPTPPGYPELYGFVYHIPFFQSPSIPICFSRQIPEPLYRNDCPSFLSVAMAIHWCFSNSSTRHKVVHYSYTPFIFLSFLTRKKSAMYLRREFVAIKKNPTNQNLTKVSLQDLSDHKKATSMGRITGIIIIWVKRVHNLWKSLCFVQHLGLERQIKVLQNSVHGFKWQFVSLQIKINFRYSQ